MPPKLEQIRGMAGIFLVSCTGVASASQSPVRKKKRNEERGTRLIVVGGRAGRQWLSVSCFHYTRVDWRWRMGIGITYLDVPRKKVSSLSRLFLMEHYRDGK